MIIASETHIHSCGWSKLFIRKWRRSQNGTKDKVAQTSCPDYLIFEETKTGPSLLKSQKRHYVFMPLCTFLRHYLLVSHLVWRAFCTEHAAAGPAVMPPPDQAEGAPAAHAERRHGVRDPGGRLLCPPLPPPVSLRLLPDPNVCPCGVNISLQVHQGGHMVMSSLFSSRACYKLCCGAWT